MACGLLGTTTFPLLFRICKPASRLTPDDGYKSKPQLAIEIIEELLARGFRIRVVLADSRYGESGPFLSALHRLGLHDVVARRSNHGVWLLPGQRIRQTRWRPFERVFTDGSSAPRFIRETIYGSRRSVRYYQITTDPATLPRETTWDLMTNQPGDLDATVGNTFGRRTWVEYGFKHRKDDLGWADSRLTDSASSARWWELVMRAYTLVSLQRLADAAHDQGQAPPPRSQRPFRPRPLPPPPWRPTPPGMLARAGNTTSTTCACSSTRMSVLACSSPGSRSCRSHMPTPSRPASPPSARWWTPSTWRSQHDRRGT
jgi:SRSO17 transposase